MTETDNVQAIIDVAREAAQTETIADVGIYRHVLIPGHGGFASKIERINLEVGQPYPTRKRGTVTCFDVASFNQLVADNSDAGNIAIYLNRDPAALSVVAVLNGNGPTGPGWGDFRVEIAFRPTPQWVKWSGLDGKLSPQADFAEFIEENLDDIIDPAGAKMLEVATELQTTRTVNFRSGIRLSSGAIQFEHNQDDSAKVGPGKVDVPDTFTLGIAPLFGMTSYEVPARFRWRIVEGKLRLGFKLQRIETMMVKIIEDVAAKIERGANVSVLDGLPPPA